MSEQRDSAPHLDRRDLLKGMAAAGLASALDPLAGALANPRTGLGGPCSIQVTGSSCARSSLAFLHKPPPQETPSPAGCPNYSR
jgi:TAT (twin-arginine translocation) pathway signal sequence